MGIRGWSRAREGLLALALACVVAAVALVIIVLRAQVSEPPVHDAGTIHPRAGQTSPRASQGSTGQHARPSHPAPLGPSRPTRITIPAIGVDTTVNPIGLNADGGLAVPQPGPHLNQAAWFENSPTPGQPGPAIIEGHVDSTEGPSVFLKLGDVKPGDQVIVHRADGRVLTFHVDAVRDFLKTHFPTDLVYGGRDLGQPSLRLITCSDFDSSIDHHIGNEVVFTHLVHTSEPS
jgi:LPXTG-site transpeptidase (sortase) family protein